MGGCDARSLPWLCPARPESATALPGARGLGNAGRSGLNAEKNSRWAGALRFSFRPALRFALSASAHG